MICYAADFLIWEERFDYADDDDIPLDLHMYVPSSGPTEFWITGSGIDGSYSDALTVRYDDNGGTVSDTWYDGFATGYDFHYGKAITTYAGEPYIAGAMGGSTSDRMLALAYEDDAPDYAHYWDRMFAGPYISSVSNEGRGIVVADVDGGGDRSIFIVGVSTESGEGRQFTTWRYKEQ